ncbi:MAG: electron transfer flavoprotein subunit alpha [Bacilli bacterium]
MGKLVIHKEKLTPQVIEQLIKVCPFGAIEYTDELSINSGCRMCKLCVKRGPQGAITYEEEKIQSINKDEWIGIAVFMEHDGHEIHPVSFELIGKAKELAKITHQSVMAVLMCEDATLFENEILSYGVDQLYIYEHPELSHFNVEKYTNCMENFINKVKPSVVLYGGTSTGRSFGPRVAARFHTGLTADCTILGMKENTDLIQNRPAFGGNIMASIVCPNTRPQMATVRYKIFPMPKKVVPTGKTTHMPITFSLKANANLLEVKLKEKIVDISEADVLVAVGRAFKSKDDLALAQELAELLGGQLACTRPMIECGLMDAKKQIGLSGRTVAPKLLITLGISGAVQFSAGMSGAQTVFSINQDKNAPIFDVCHYGLVGDAFKIVPELIKQIKIMKGVK